MQKKYNFVPYHHPSFPDEEQLVRSKEYLEFMDQRRTVRSFSEKDVPKEIISNIIMTASTAPSGAHKQPWTFCAVKNQDLKTKIRIAAEEEEYQNYHGRMPEEWLRDLAPLQTNWEKEFIEIAPWLIVVFKKAYDFDGQIKRKNYYVNESVGIATGILISAIHNAGLISLTHTPSPMNFLQEILKRPENERAFLLIPVGYPAEKSEVPDLLRKKESEIAVYYE